MWKKEHVLRSVWEYTGWITGERFICKSQKPWTKNEKQTNKQQYVILFSKVFILVARKDATKCKADDETADSNEGVKESKVFQLLWGKKNWKDLGKNTTLRTNNRAHGMFKVQLKILYTIITIKKRKKKNKQT